MLKQVLLLGCIALLTCPVTLADTAAASPRGAFVAPSLEAGRVEVAWLPPPEGATGYRVYGYADGGWTRLSETADLHATVAEGYSRYSVAAMNGSVESQKTEAMVCVQGREGIPPYEPFIPCPA